VLLIVSCDFAGWDGQSIPALFPGGGVEERGVLLSYNLGGLAEGMSELRRGLRFFAEEGKELKNDCIGPGEASFVGDVAEEDFAGEIR
jgi:hypothetical protein